MRKLLALLSALASPALAQTPAGTINSPIYATGYISQVGGTNVTTKIPPQPNHPTNLNIYPTGAVTGTWTIQLPNPAFEGQVLSFNCGSSASVVAVISTDGSSLDSSIPVSCNGNSGFVVQFDQRSNIWRNLGSNTTVLAGVTVNNNTQLTALPPPITVAVRLGFAAAGDAPAVTYTRSNSACSLNSGAGDGGSQVPTSDGKCWIATLPSPADVRIWGAKLDGSTDDAAVANAALTNYKGAVLLPDSTSGLFVGASSTVDVKYALVGERFSAHISDVLANGSSYIKCAVPRSVPCVRTNVSGATPYIDSVAVIGNGTPSVGGAAGLQIAEGTSITGLNILVGGFDTCLMLGPESTTGSLNVKFYNFNAGWCQTHYIVNDGWPEAYFIGGRLGQNGVGDYPAATDFVYQTRTGTLGAGGGPNTMTFDAVHFNTGVGGIGCAFNWGGFTGSGGVSGVTKINNAHIEWHSYTGAGKQGIFCSDATVPMLDTIQMSNTDTSVSVPIWSLDSLTALKKFHITGSVVNCSTTTLAPTPASGYSMQDVHLGNNSFFCDVSVTAAGSGNTFHSTGNKYGTLTIAGPWAQFASAGDYFSSISTSTATGQVSIDNPKTESWTPTLNFGGATTGITQSVQAGLWQRTAGGGTRAYFIITLSSKGTATGAATITGFPVTCASSFAAAPLTTAGNLSGLTSTAFAKTNGASSSLSLQQMGAAGIANLTDTNFTNTSSIAGTVTCGTAQ